jgi:DNA-binding NtrC family response regulator
MQSSHFQSDDVSTGAVAGRVHGAARIVLCVADSTAREQLARVAAEFAVLDIAAAPDRAIPLLLREPASLIVIDEPSLLAGTGVDSSSRNIRDLAGAVAANLGGTQLLILSSHGSLAALPNVLRTDEVASRVTVLNPEGLTSDALRTLLTLTIRQSELVSQRQNFRQPIQSHSLSDILGSSASMQQLFAGVDEAAASDSPILICGEFGTGTSLIGNAIHDGGTRAGQSFVRVHSRSLTAESLSELLCLDVGPEATTLPLDTPTKPIGGTLFLDEIDAFPVALHKTLCRFIERQQELVEGSQGRHRPLVRIVAATHLNLDLPSRQTLGLEILTRGMNAKRLLVPALRERPEDIGPLSEQFFIRWALQEDQPRPRLTRNALEVLKEHLWPGNVRELYTVLRNTAIVAESGDVTADMLRSWLAKSVAVEVSETPRMTLADMERQLIETTFTRCGGNREKTAQSLDIGLRTLSGKLREYGYPPRGGPGSNLKAA